MRSQVRSSPGASNETALHLSEKIREDRDAYLIGIIRALDGRILRVSAMMSLSSHGSCQPASSGRGQELARRLSDLESARADLLDVVFRSTVSPERP